MSQLITNRMGNLVVLYSYVDSLSGKKKDGVYFLQLLSSCRSIKVKVHSGLSYFTHTGKVAKHA